MRGKTIVEVGPSPERRNDQIFDRLHSIEWDIEFVSGIHRALQLPLIANQRCGAWYVDPSVSIDRSLTAYFKSTDGHHSQWNFNLRRSNLHLLPIIFTSNGIVIVDSTRRGKRFPDALSKTVPIWCAVLNMARIRLSEGHLSGSLSQDPTWLETSKQRGLYTLNSAVSLSERDHILDLIPDWTDELLNSSFDIKRILEPMIRPLKPIWIDPSNHSQVSLDRITHSDFYPVICVSASELKSAKRSDKISTFDYIQGSGDDHEAWSLGLNAEMFWYNRETLLTATRDELRSVVQQIVAPNSNSTQQFISDVRSYRVRKTGLEIVLEGIENYSNLSSNENLMGLTVFIASKEKFVKMISSKDQTTVQLIGDQTVLKNLSASLSQIVPSCVRVLGQMEPVRLIAGASHDGGSKDLLVAIGLCTLIMVYHNNGLCRSSPPSCIDKSDIRLKLQWMIEDSNGKLNPSRSILKRVNNYLINWKKDS
ncbi:initiator tRNA phosphoribosyl transferase [Phakopsora pachyrhizi]|uniref:Initiator tRNA phosphoribosyl transferase n=1 Tax=Phakopsora pachyrhizi TaxID=170000 RepID=A0AAV0AXS2_PHAPC|nr:initiator tRNA phosphoribosyl transferase [Phakopsora pachyrhizi]CAH7673332.1 initiator tRNA phosphoribosyl transferase [Phakopsora pachyrhizi]